LQSELVQTFPKKLPELGKGIGDGIRGFKSAMKDREDSSEKTTAAKDQEKTIV
jgi:Sec-independent protein translocase protein TatA